MALTKVYINSGSKNVRIDKGEGDELFIPAGMLRMESKGLYLHLRDAFYDVEVAKILFTEVANSAGTAIGTKTQVLTALEQFIGGA